MALTISNLEEQYSLRVPAHRFRQGDRTAYSFALDVATLSGLLPERVDEDIVRDANRRLSVSHARNIQRYLLNTPSDWVLGSLLLGISPEAVVFQPYPDEDGRPSDIFGELRILGAEKHTMKIFDGQHRRRAIADALEELATDDARGEQLAHLRSASVPIVLFIEKDLGALRQMFVDASKTKSIESNTITRFDERDAFNLAARHVADSSRLFANRVEMERSTVRRSGGCLIAINQLAATLKTLDVGYNGRVSRERNSDHLLDLDALYGRCLIWADEFMPAARDEYADLISGELDEPDIPALRPTTFAFNATMIRILAGCYHTWTRDRSDWEPLAEFIRGASLEPGKFHGEGSLLVEAGVVLPGGTTPMPRSQEMVGAINFIIDRVKQAGANNS